MRKRALFACLLVMLVALNGCQSSLFYTHAETDSYDYGYSAIFGDAFIIACYYDGEEDRSFIIPETVDGYRVTALGGYYGTGVLAPFCIQLENITLPVVGYTDFASFQEQDPEALEVHYYDFQLVIGADLQEIFVEAHVTMYEAADGEKTALHIPRVYIQCSEDNASFYSEDGRLYHKDGTLVDGFIYHDQTLFD